MESIEKLTPVKTAKILQVPPQKIYGLIKSGRIKTYPNPQGGTQLIDPSEVKEAFGNPIRQKRPEGHGPEEYATRMPAGVKEGALLSYQTTFATTQLHLVTNGAPGCYLFSYERADRKKGEASREGLSKRLRHREIEIVRPWELLEFAARTFVARGELVVAEGLRNIIAIHGDQEELPPTEDTEVESDNTIEERVE